MKTQQTPEQQAVAFLVKVKAWLNSEDRLVKNWANTWENSAGDRRAEPGLACRACAFGAPNMVAQPKERIVDIAYRALDDAAEAMHFKRCKPNTLRGVHRLYYRAIASLKREAHNA